MSSNGKQKSFGIIGLGPVGTILGVHLQEAGYRVMVCDADRVKINQVKNEGVRLENVIVKQARFSDVFNSTLEMMAANPDYLVVSLKSYQVESILNDIPENNTSVFISAQNGIDVENIISNVVGESRTMRMVINYAGNMGGAYVTKVTFFNPPNYIASLDDSLAADAEEIAAKLTSVKLDTVAISSFDLRKHAWEKTILNASLSPLCGIGRFTMAEAMAFPDTVELVEQIIEEAVMVAEAEKINFPDDFIRNCLRYLRKGGNHFPSLAVDLMNSRETEIDYMNGKIVEYGRKHYVRTPLNLSMVNMVKAMTRKNVESQLEGGKARTGQSAMKLKPIMNPKGVCYLGIDLGSAYTKFTIIDEKENVVFRYLINTLNRDKVAVKHILEAIHADFNIGFSCATGYGRKHFPDADVVKTEINCAAEGVNKVIFGEKNILDIGGEDIKMIRCDKEGKVENFYLNDKCAAGTGAFLSEIAERAGIDIKEMSRLAEQSNYKQELNSFCTVFAKTEIMKWIFDGQPIENLAKGIYLSIVQRIAKMRIDPGIPVVMIGGVIEHHPYLKNLLEEKFKTPVTILDHPQHIVSFGAALLAKSYSETKVTEPA